MCLAARTMAADVAQEYAEVRRLALKDPKVQAAFEKANERLIERMVEIDPSLKPYIDKLPAHGAEPLGTTEEEKLERRPAALPVAAGAGEEHVTVKGETLTSIAGHYHVTVTALKRANHITDERKLQIGQKLVIPSAGVAAAATPAVRTPAAEPSATPVPSATPKGDAVPGWLDELKRDL